MRSLYRLTLLLAALAAASYAQEIRGSILGRVLDSSGLTVPGAKVVVVNQETNVAVEVTTNEEGRYVAPFLTPGQYRVRVDKDGFNRVERENLILQTQDRLTIDVTLRPGAVSETVTVSAESPILQTASADFGQVVSNQFVDRLPTVGSSPLGLADMAPGVVPTNPDGNNINYTSSYVQVNGSSGTGNQMTIDGAPAEVPRMSGVTYVMPMAGMLQEMKVVTAMFDAAQGRTNGGSILVSTKPGTNQYHGNAYYHFRDERFNANSWTNNYQNRPRGTLNYWMMGGVFGGPIRRDRTFFNMGIEKERNIQTYDYRFRVPTELERAGDFSQTLNSSSTALQIYDPLSTQVSGGKITSRSPFPGARIPGNLLNATGKALANQYPLPNYTVMPNQLSQVNYLTSVGASGPVRNYQLRVDHVLNESNRLYFRWANNFNISNDFDRAPVPGYYATSNANTDNRMANQFVVEDTATISPTLVGSFRVAYNRFNQHTSGFGDDMDPELLQLAPALRSNLYSGGSSGGGWPQITVSDGSVPSVGPLFRKSVNDVLSFTNTFNRFWGKHNTRWGADLRNTRWYENQPGAAQNGQFTFAKSLTRANDNASSETTSGSGMASLLLGYPTSGSIARNPALAVQTRYGGFFIQDDWRLTPRLTLALGLRYDLETPMTERYDRFIYGFDKDASLGINIPSFGPLAGGLEFAGVNGVTRRQGNLDADNFGPRISAAYVIDSKTVLRAGWGLFYQGLSNNISGQVPQAGPTYNMSTSYVGSADSYRTVLPGVSLANPFPNGLTAITGSSLGLLSQLGANISFADPNRQLPSVHQMQVSIQRQMPWKSVFEAAYVGTRYNGLYRDYNINDVPDAYMREDQSVANPFYGALPSNSTRGSANVINANLLKTAFPHFGSITQQMTNGPWGRYHGLQARWEKRMSHGVQFVANYTFSKNMYFDVQSIVNSRFYKSVTDTDRPHVARLFLTADLPFGHKRHFGNSWPRFLDTIAGGWAITWVTRFSSGAALGLSGPVGRPIPIANPATGASAHDCLGDPVGATPTTPCLDASKVLSLSGKYDITPEPPRYSWLRGPGYADHDVTIFKTFRIVEKVKFELRADANNLPNTPQWGNPRTDISNLRTFGTINSGGNPRTVRLTGRINF